MTLYRAGGWRAEASCPAAETARIRRPYRQRLGASTGPRRTSLRDLVVDVLDQGGLGACVSRAFAQLVRMRRIALGLPAVLPSSAYLHYLARRYEGLDQLDIGTTFSLVAAAADQMGIPDEGLWPYSDLDTGSGLDPFRRLPPAELFQHAYDSIPSGGVVDYEVLTSTGDQLLRDLEDAIAEGCPPGVGLLVSHAMTRGQLTGRELQETPAGGDVAGGHAMAVVERIMGGFRLLSSWGPGAGDGGYFCFSDAAMATAMDGVVIRGVPC